tara:strand:- start:30980 stop:31933 length:954 start_codon:yes stop_codon:yes gene_type:complete
MSGLKVKVTAVEEVAEQIKHFSFVAEEGFTLPYFSGGSHVVVAMDIDGRTHRNAYSLMGPTSDTSCYQIAVRKQESSRGGSVFMHENVLPGAILDISMPTNLFAIHRLAKKHILVAGGIGITPFMSHISDLNRLGYDYELHYAYRSKEHAAFRKEIETLCGNKAFFYPENETGRLDMTALLSKQPIGSHAYVCGPDPMVNSLEVVAKQLGWPESAIHSEKFLAPASGAPFSISLLQSNTVVEVPSDLSMLEAMEAAGIDAPYLCRGGACGRCEVEVVECDGNLVHHDHYLSGAERMAANKILPCVSRANCSRIVINL